MTGSRRRMEDLLPVQVTANQRSGFVDGAVRSLEQGADVVAVLRV